MEKVILYADNPGLRGLTAIKREVEAAGKVLVIKPLKAALKKVKHHSIK